MPKEMTMKEIEALGPIDWSEWYVLLCELLHDEMMMHKYHFTPVEIVEGAYRRGLITSTETMRLIGHITTYGRGLPAGMCKQLLEQALKGQ